MEEQIYINEEKEMEELKELIELKDKAINDLKFDTIRLFNDIQRSKNGRKKEVKMKNNYDVMKEIAIDKAGNEILGTDGVNDIEVLKDYTVGNLLTNQEGLKELNELIADFKDYEKGMKKEDTKEDFMEVFANVNFEVWESYFIGRFRSYGIEETININNIEQCFQFHNMLKDIEFELWSVSNPPNAKLLKRGLTLGLVPSKNENFKDFKYRCDLLEYPMTDGQKTRYKNLLKASGMKAMDIMKEIKIERTKFEGFALIEKLENTVPPTEGHISYINNLQQKLGYDMSTPKTRKSANELCTLLKYKYALKLGASFQTVEEIKAYAEEQAKENKCYVSDIIDGLIQGLETDRKIQYFKNEEVRSDLQRRIAHTLGR